jgi:type IV pilus assembly protein PilW
VIVRHCSQRRQRGVGLVELAIVLLLGTLLIAGALAVHQRARAAMRTADTVARLQDAGRLALDVIEADVRMAGFWGRFDSSALVVNRAGPGQPLPASFTPLQGTRIDSCGGAGSRWAIDLDTPIGGTDDAYGLSCVAVGEPRPGADTLVVRRAAEAPSTSLAAGRIHLQASHLGGALFVPSPGCTDPMDVACLPDGYSPQDSQARTLVVRAYYVASSSTQQAGMTSLRRKSFGNVNAASVAAALSDEEVVAGVEDLQVRFGVDTDGDGNVDGHADPGAVPAGATVVTATTWLLVRAEDREAGYLDLTAYSYGDLAEPYVPGDAYRRVLVSRTFELRNAPP